MALRLPFPRFPPPPPHTHLNTPPESKGDGTSAGQIALLLPESSPPAPGCWPPSCPAVPPSFPSALPRAPARCLLTWLALVQWGLPSPSVVWVPPSNPAARDSDSCHPCLASASSLGFGSAFGAAGTLPFPWTPRDVPPQQLLGRLPRRPVIARGRGLCSRPRASMSGRHTPKPGACRRRSRLPPVPAGGGA